MRKLKVLFIGQNGLFTTEPLKKVARRHRIIGLVESLPFETRKKNDPFATYRADRARKLYPDITGRKETLKVLAGKYGVPLFTLKNKDQSDLIRYLRELEPDVICVASMTGLLRKEAFSIPPLGSINMHPSLLPFYRGPNPWFWQYHEMEKEGGVTVHMIDEKEDNGDIIGQASYPIYPGMDFSTMFLTALPLGTDLMVRALDGLAVNRIERRSQRGASCPVRARNISPDEKLIDFTKWSVERTWHVMQGTPLWIDPIPFPADWRNGSFWRVTGCSNEPTKGIPGTISQDGEGYYAIHSKGRIRLSLEH